ncbi:hypothetical protein [Microbulbifer yueqingensis]|uniref:Uncharacterized protein n=1 Tax=Microbulbifer yueqingensis TaxID=658219 RepID=A0A1G9DYC2_9GAMM|nr:hypothetical protein [Microbulbifer yueqingensis]SDK68865.1 hypothetical protein SAMN05216212_2943 [Microbulbifer yueqingensis]
MTKPQLFFGLAVGTLLAALGGTLSAAGITGSGLAATGVLVLLVNAAYWTLGQRRRPIPVESPPDRRLAQGAG